MFQQMRADILGEGATVETPFGTRRITYADHIASGRALASVEEALRATVLPHYANTHTEDSATGASTTHLVHDAAEYIKTCLGADENYKIVFPGTGATGALKRLQEILGVSVAGQWRSRLLEILDPTERLVVFVGPYEHHSNELSWRESLAEVVTVPLDADGLIDLTALEELLADSRFEGRRKLGSFSAASNVTGLLTDVRAIAAALHRHGALAVFDFAASAPYVKIDIGASAPGADDWLDALVLSPHKFLGGPGSTGLLVFHRSLYQLSSPTTAGGGTVSYVSYTKHRYYDDIEIREDAGTPGILQKLRAAMAFKVKEQLGVEAIEARERELIAEALPRLAAIEGVRLLGNVEAPRLAVASFLVESGGKQLHAKFVVRLVADLFGIQGRAGCSCAGPYGHALLNIDEETSACFLDAIDAGYEGVKPGWTRLSFHYLCDDDEIAFLIDAVAFVARHGFRFLPQYSFDWHSGAWRHRSGMIEKSARHDTTGDAEMIDLVDFDPASWRGVERSPAPRHEDYAAYLSEAERLAAALADGATDLPAEPGVTGGPRVENDAPSGLDERVLWFAR